MTTQRGRKPNGRVDQEDLSRHAEAVRVAVALCLKTIVASIVSFMFVKTRINLFNQVTCDCRLLFFIPTSKAVCAIVLLERDTCLYAQLSSFIDPYSITYKHMLLTSLYI